ncbi:MAG: methyltransferase domain-containing protein, partial [Gemmatimonadales bacterium]
ARLATVHGVPTAVAAANSLPFAPRSVDLILLSQFLHHLDDDEAVAILREADRIARHGVVVADLRRSEVAAAGFRLGSRLLRFDPATRADGVMSVRRGYLPAELLSLLDEARVSGKVWRRPGYRLVAAWHPAA